MTAENEKQTSLWQVASLLEDYALELESKGEQMTFTRRCAVEVGTVALVYEG